MKRILTHALRNLAAHSRKTWAIGLSIAAGTCALLLIGGYYEYTYWGLKESLIRSQYGHLQIYPKGYLKDRDNDPFAHSIQNAEGVIAYLEELPDVLAVSERSRSWALANGEPIELWGTVPEKEGQIFTFRTSQSGMELSSFDSNACRVSPTLSSRLGAKLGETVTVSGVREDYQLNAIDLTVQSITGSYSEDFDLMVMEVPRSVFLDLFGTDGIHEIAVLYENDANLFAKRDALREALQDRGWDTDIKVWYEQAGYFRQVVDYYQGFYSIVLCAVSVIVFFAAGTTMALSLLERTREFGTLLSMGEGRSRLALGILVESLFAGGAGLAAGWALSALIAWLINSRGGIHMAAAPGLSTDIQIFISFSPQGAILSALTACIVPPFAVMFPARRILTQSVVRLLNKGER